MSYFATFTIAGPAYHMVLKFQADRLFTGNTLLDDAVLITGPEGIVQDIVPAAEAGEDIRRYTGTITPGHINCHCHLELSHMKGVIPEGTGLPRFIGAVMKAPVFTQSQKLQAMDAAANEMYEAGIHAVGDISNHILSLQSKTRSPIRWHNFLEISNLDDNKAPLKLAAFDALQQEFREHFPSTVLSPHAIYSVSPETFRLINRHTAGQTITIHNQECPAEDELFKYGTGDFLPFYRSIGRSTLPVTVSGKSSLQTWLPWFNEGQTIVLVHNTCTSEEDLVFALDYAAASGLKLYFCLCPGANMYIEQEMPPVALLMKHNCNIVLGTDSYASNRQLSITAEAALLKQQFPGIPDATLLRWMTTNGAQALGLDPQSGNFTKGTRPGVVWVEADFTASHRLI